MPRPLNTTPTLEYRIGWGWRARIRGKQFRLGGVNTSESEAKVALGKLIVLVASNPGVAAFKPANATMVHLICAFLQSDESPPRHAKQHRGKYEQLVGLFDAAFGGEVYANEYNAERHRQFKAWLIAQTVPGNSKSRRRVFPGDFDGGIQKPLEKCPGIRRADVSTKPRFKRWTVNDFLSRVRRLVKFGRSRKFCPADHAAEVCDVPGVRHGDCEESSAVEPANVEDVIKTLAFLPAELRPAVQIQLLCGARANELLQIKTSLIDRTCTPWEYRPIQHKGSWRGGIRAIYFGPRARAILTTIFAGMNGDDYLFSPQRSRPNRTGRLAPRPHYSRHSYSHAIYDACRKAGVTPWTSHQLRHRCGTDVRQAMGYDAAQAVLGHAGRTVTDRYSWHETAGRLAREAMERMG